MQQLKIERDVLVRRIILFLLIILLIIFSKRIIFRNIEENEKVTSSNVVSNIAEESNNIVESNISSNEVTEEEIEKIKVVIGKEEKEINLDWNLLLVNTNNKIPDGYKVSLKNIDSYRSFDKRAIEPLTQMIKAIRDAGISNIWIQSAYRTPEDQETLFENQVQAYTYQGYDEKKARELTEKIINKPWHSEHNLGLAVDFNYVNREFETTAAFQWLQKNAQNYGFILRYTQEKEEITKVSYEPWHWRYVGKEHAQQMKNQGLCLEEYIEKNYLKK